MWLRRVHRRRVQACRRVARAPSRGDGDVAGGRGRTGSARAAGLASARRGFSSGGEARLQAGDVLGEPALELAELVEHRRRFRRGGRRARLHRGGRGGPAGQPRGGDDAAGASVSTVVVGGGAGALPSSASASPARSRRTPRIGSPRRCQTRRPRGTRTARGQRRGWRRCLRRGGGRSGAGAGSTEALCRRRRCRRSRACARRAPASRGVIAQQVRAEPVARARDRRAKGGGASSSSSSSSSSSPCRRHAEHAFEVGLRLGILVPAARRRGVSRRLYRRVATAHHAYRMGMQTLHLVRGDDTRAGPLGGIERLGWMRSCRSWATRAWATEAPRAPRLRASRPHRFAIWRRGHRRPGFRGHRLTPHRRGGPTPRRVRSRAVENAPSHPRPRPRL